MNNPLSEKLREGKAKITLWGLFVIQGLVPCNISSYKVLGFINDASATNGFTHLYRVDMFRGHVQNIFGQEHKVCPASRFKTASVLFPSTT